MINYKRHKKVQRLKNKTTAKTTKHLQMDKKHVICRLAIGYELQSPA